MAENTPKNAVVTGASSGIGAATVRQLRKDGWNVIAVARRADRLAALADESGALYFPADVTKDDDVAGLRDFAAKAFGPRGIDTLINIAGGARGADTVANAKDGDWEWMFQVNVMGTLKTIKTFLPALRDNGNGTILNLTSTAAHTAYEGWKRRRTTSASSRWLPAWCTPRSSPATAWAETRKPPTCSTRAWKSH